jgi:hypothetical protein
VTASGRLIEYLFFCDHFLAGHKNVYSSPRTRPGVRKPPADIYIAADADGVEIDLCPLWTNS